MATNSKKKTVIIVGARGFVGAQVLDAVLRKNSEQNNNNLYSTTNTVKALIRPGSNATAIEAKGVVVARGDMMDAASLVSAFAQDDDDNDSSSKKEDKQNDVTVISIANGYMSGMPEVDTVGMRNVVDACKTCGVKRYVIYNIYIYISKSMTNDRVFVQSHCTLK
jgi:nucleoside-diphosphate-sugar epimerase